MIRGVKQPDNLFAMEAVMKTKTCAMTLAFLFAAAAVCFASTDVQLGTWKLNESKSKLAAGIPHNNTVVYEAAGDSIKVTIDGATARDFDDAILVESNSEGFKLFVAIADVSHYVRSGTAIRWT